MSFPYFDFSFEKHFIEVKVKQEIETKWDTFLDFDVDITKDIDVDIDVDIEDIEGNNSIVSASIKDTTGHTFLVDTHSTQGTTPAVGVILESIEDTSSKSVLSIQTDDWGFAGQATARGVDVDTFTEITFNAVLSHDLLDLVIVGEALLQD